MTVAPFHIDDDIRIEFPVAHDTPWATLHRGPLQVELGPIHDDADLQFALSVAAALLVELAGTGATPWRSPDGNERYVLVGCWILVERTHIGVRHLQFPTPTEAANGFARITGDDHGNETSEDRT